jgi:hypothetical protein
MYAAGHTEVRAIEGPELHDPRGARVGLWRLTCFAQNALVARRSRVPQGRTAGRGVPGDPPRDPPLSFPGPLFISRGYDLPEPGRRFEEGS